MILIIVGGYGQAKACINKKTGQERAVKIMQKSGFDEKQLKQFINEVEILRQLDHPHIVKLFEVYEDAQHFYLVQE